MDKNQTDKLTFKDFILSLTWSLKIFWKISPKLSTLILFSTIIDSLRSLAYSYILAKGIDQIISLSRSPNPSLMSLTPTILSFFIFSLGFSLIGNLNNFADNQLRLVMNPKMRVLLYQVLRSSGIQTLESPDINNSIERARNNLHYLQQRLNLITGLISSLTSTIGSGIIIYFFAPWFIPLTIIASIPVILSDQHFLRKLWNLERETTESGRQAWESIHFLIDPKSLHELLITKGYKLLVDKFNRHISYVITLNTKIRIRWYFINLVFGLVRTASRLAGFAFAFWRYILGKTSIGTVTFYINAIEQFSTGIFRISMDINNMYESSHRINEIRNVFNLKPSFADGKIKLPILEKGPQIRFSNVSFAYPGATTKVINNLNLTIKPGEKIAIVGHNGAGKTTLVKLITRFYQITEGELLIHGHNINQLKITSLYKNLSVLFQEYNRYPHLTASENIYIGNVNKTKNQAKITKSSKKADADNFISEYQYKYDQTLSEKYKGGIRPSTGQWQKIAIARFFYRNTPIIIFDEPTSAIDAVSESKIFNKIYRFFKNKTVIIISHRFSTVRNADRIIAFDHGQIIEHGSHKELMDIKGAYYKAFKLQAEGYKA